MIRLMAKVVKQEGGCWVWTGLTRAGYGRIKDKGHMVSAHRATYEHFRGPIPAGLQIDHLCRNRSCVNPDHLEPVDNRTNAMRGSAPSIALYLKQRCSKGHDLSTGNYYVLKSRGARLCKECSRQYRERYALLKRQKQQA